eukprot:13056549-Alexandrium_andersonii.AAC.1
MLAVTMAMAYMMEVVVLVVLLLPPPMLLLDDGGDGIDGAGGNVVGVDLGGEGHVDDDDDG